MKNYLDSHNLEKSCEFRDMKNTWFIQHLWSHAKCTSFNVWKSSENWVTLEIPWNSWCLS